MPDNHEIRTVHAHELDRLAATLTVALSADPTTRWAAPRADQYLAIMPSFVLAAGGEAAVRAGTAYAIGDFLGCAIWLSPNTMSDEERIASIFSENIEEPHLSRVFSMFAAMGRYHPHVAHWQLPLIGIDPVYQRMGLGSKLLGHGLRSCVSGLPVYLEATSRDSLALYRRHGFELLGEVSGGGSPPMFAMLRTGP